MSPEKSDQLLSTADARKLAVQQSSESESEAPMRLVPTRTQSVEQRVESGIKQALQIAENLTFPEEVSVGLDFGKSNKVEA